MINTYKKLLHFQDASFLQIDHEEAMVAVVYLVTQPNGEQSILKVCDRPNDYLREVYFLKRLAKTLPVPKILQVIPPTPDLHGAILMEKISGTLLKEAELTESLAYEIGRHLAFIHLNRLPGYGDPIQGDLNPDPRIYFTLKFEEGLDECKHHLPRDLIEKCRRFYQTNVDLLLTVDGPCIAHRDFRPSNLLIQEGKLCGIIDWAGARASFAEEDLSSLEHGEWANYPHVKKPFLEGYASVRPVPNVTPLIPLLRLNKAIATIGFTVKRNTWERNHHRIYQYNRQFLNLFFD